MKNNSINTLEWITCPHCGINFRVSVSRTIEQIFVEVQQEREYYNEEFDDNGKRSIEQKTTCPHCSKKFYFYLICRDDNE